MMTRAILAFATLIAFSQAATAGLPLFSHVSCATVRFYVAMYSATAAEKWARSHGASDAEIETARRCLHIETVRLAAKSQVLTPVTEQDRDQHEPVKPVPAQALNVVPEPAQRADPDQDNQDNGDHGSIRPKDIENPPAGHASDEVKNPARADGTPTVLPARHIGAMHRAKSVGAGGHVSWLKRLWDHLSRPRHFRIAFLHFPGGRRYR
jgi:hypothetical protein